MEDTNSALELSKSINLLDVVYFATKTCEQVSPQTIQNCFRKSGFGERDNSNDDNCWTAEDDLPLTALAQFSNLINRIQNQMQIDVEDYTNLDSDIIINDEYLENISTEMIIASQENLHNSSEDEEREIDDKLTPYKEAYIAIKKLKAFSSYRSDFKSVQLLTDLQIHLSDIEIKEKTY